MIPTPTSQEVKALHRRVFARSVVVAIPTGCLGAYVFGFFEEIPIHRIGVALACASLPCSSQRSCSGSSAVRW